MSKHLIFQAGNFCEQSDYLVFILPDRFSLLLNYPFQVSPAVSCHANKFTTFYQPRLKPVMNIGTAERIPARLMLNFRL